MAGNPEMLPEKGWKEDRIIEFVVGSDTCQQMINERNIRKSNGITAIKRETIMWHYVASLEKRTLW